MKDCKRGGVLEITHIEQNGDPIWGGELLAQEQDFFEVKKKSKVIF